MKQTQEDIDFLSENSKEWGKFISQISHLLCTKLATLRLKESGLQQLIPSLLDENTFTIQAKKETRPFKYSPADVEQMINLSQQINPAMELLKRVNDYLHESYSNEPISIRNCINHCLTSYPFIDEEQRSLVQIESGLDYQFKISRVIMEDLLSHLLARSLNNINQKGQGNIKIWLSKNNNETLLHFKDESQDLTSEEQTRIFERFIFIDKSNIIHFGLGFFRLVMGYKGGNIVCNSLNKSTYFTISETESTPL